MILQKLSRSRLEAYASPLVVVGAAAILAVVVIALAVYNVNRETRFTSTILSEKGAVLVRTFEAGTRAGMMGMWGAQQRIQILAEQFAMLPGITSITLTDMQGRVRAGSDPERLGNPFLDPETFQKLAPSKDLQWFVTDTPQGGRSFLVYKIFTPLDFRGHGFGRSSQERGPRGRMAERMRRNWQHFCSMANAPENSGDDQQQAPESPAEGGDQAPPDDTQQAPELRPEPTPYVLLVSMDITPFEEARAQDIRTTILLAATLLALGLGGVVALYWAQRLRASRRMLLDARAFASEVITHMPMGLIAMDPQGRITMVNNTAETVLGDSCNLQTGENFTDCLPQPLVQTLEKVRSGEDVVEQEMLLDVGREAPLPLAISGARIFAEEGRDVGAILLLRDLRELKRLEAAVRRAEKLAAIGSLAAGVAHEIRNPLSSIKASATYFSQQFDDQSDGQRMAEIMIQEVERLNRAVTQLLEYARPSQLAGRDVEPAKLVERSLELVRRDALAQGVEVRLEAQDAPHTAWMDPDRMTQALLNLFVNAIQAMEQGGQLTVRVQSAPGDALRMEVSDTGPGLPEKLMGDVKRIFDPYVTTKARGTGLGLAIVQKIIEAHQGEVAVHSTPGKGVTFVVTLPLQPGQPEAAGSEESHT